MCSNCNGMKTFICQLRVDHLPLPMQKELDRTNGLFQLFCCLKVKCPGGRWDNVDVDDAFFMEEADLRVGLGLKGLAAKEVLKLVKADENKKTWSLEAELPTHLVDFVRGMDNEHQGIQYM